jgi:hypothetical protein
MFKPLPSRPLFPLRAWCLHTGAIEVKNYVTEIGSLYWKFRFKHNPDSICKLWWQQFKIYKTINLPVVLKKICVTHDGEDVDVGLLGCNAVLTRR